MRYGAASSVPSSRPYSFSAAPHPAARAIATDPEVVLYDEPTAGLDPLTVGTINSLIRKLQRELGVTSVLVSHDIRAGFRVANRVSLLRDGKIQFIGTPEEMVAADDPYINAFLS